MLKRYIQKENKKIWYLVSLIKFSIVGIANTAIDLFLFLFLTQIIHWHVLPANILSYSTGIINSFIINKIWTFKDRRPFSKSLTPFMRFILINLSSLILSTFFVWLLSQFFSVVISKAFSIVITLIWNYSFTRLLVFIEDS